MAKVITKSGDAAGAIFGIAVSEGTGMDIISKVSLNLKANKKDLRGRLGGYKGVSTYGKAWEASIDGSVQGGAAITKTLGDSHALVNDLTLVPDGVLTIEGFDINHKGDDHATFSIKLSGFGGVDDVVA
jgi:hypothetical protein